MSLYVMFQLSAANDLTYASITHPPLEPSQIGDEREEPAVEYDCAISAASLRRRYERSRHLSVYYEYQGVNLNVAAFFVLR